MTYTLHQNVNGTWVPYLRTKSAAVAAAVGFRRYMLGQPVRVGVRHARA